MKDMECMFCERRCELDTGKKGFCGMYGFSPEKGVIELFPHRYSTVSVSHIESLPIFHFHPGSRTLMLGSAGCNLDCAYCLNAYAAKSDPERLLAYRLSAERVIAMAKECDCLSITFGVNEPLVSLPSLLELAHQARQHGIFVGALTNGYGTLEATKLIGEAFAFVNVSLKSIRDDFYKSYAGVPSVKIVIRNIEVLSAMTHVEITTPIIAGLNDGEIPEIARFIKSFRPEIAWHVFRLLPEHRMACRRPPNIDRINEMLKESRRDLPYVYFGNFPGSQWVSTLCPECGTAVIKRINTGSCGSKLISHQLNENRCTACNFPLPIKVAVQHATNNVSQQSGVEAKPKRKNGGPKKRRMLGVINAGDWQTIINLEDGSNYTGEHQLLPLVGEVLRAHPYPGDLNPSSAQWVTDVALDINESYHPNFMMLIYATPFFAALVRPLSERERKSIIEEVFFQINRFIETTGFMPVIVGLGDMVKARDEVNLLELDGLAIASPPFGDAGLYRPTQKDLERLHFFRGIAQFIDCLSFQKEFGGNPCFYQRFPEYLLIAEEGYFFKGLGSGSRPVHWIPKREKTIPMYLPDHPCKKKITDITSVAGRVLGLLNAGIKTCLIVVEGVGSATFPIHFSKIANSCRWYSYLSSCPNQYQALTTGNHLIEGAYPPGYPYYEDEAKGSFPFSGLFAEMPAGTIGSCYKGRSAAVGNRSIFTHVYSGCDVVIECRCCNLFNYGELAVVKI